MKNQRVLELANKFADMTKMKSPVNVEFHAQRQRFSDFFEMFRKNLRTIIGEMGSEISTLKGREFDTKMLVLLNKVYHDVIEVYRTTKQDDPYAAAGKLVQLVLERPNGPVIENLDFLTKHHLKQTNVDFGETESLRHPQIRSLELLKTLATQLRQFMATYPLVKPPAGQSNRPVSLKENVQDISPGDKLGPEDVTKPGIIG
jgi:hypothetical protein